MPAASMNSRPSTSTTGSGRSGSASLSQRPTRVGARRVDLAREGQTTRSGVQLERRVDRRRAGVERVHGVEVAHHLGAGLPKVARAHHDARQPRDQEVGPDLVAAPLVAHTVGPEQGGDLRAHAQAGEPVAERLPHQAARGRPGGRRAAARPRTGSAASTSSVRRAPRGRAAAPTSMPASGELGERRVPADRAARSTSGARSRPARPRRTRRGSRDAPRPSAYDQQT